MTPRWAASWSGFFQWCISSSSFSCRFKPCTQNMYICWGQIPCSKLVVVLRSQTPLEENNTTGQWMYLVYELNECIYLQTFVRLDSWLVLWWVGFLVDKIKSWSIDTLSVQSCCFLKYWSVLLRMNIIENWPRYAHHIIQLFLVSFVYTVVYDIAHHIRIIYLLLKHYQRVEDRSCCSSSGRSSGFSTVRGEHIYSQKQCSFRYI